MSDSEKPPEEVMEAEKVEEIPGKFQQVSGVDLGVSR